MESAYLPYFRRGLGGVRCAPPCWPYTFLIQAHYAVAHGVLAKLLQHPNDQICAKKTLYDASGLGVLRFLLITNAQGTIARASGTAALGFFETTNVQITIGRVWIRQDYSRSKYTRR